MVRKRLHLAGKQTIVKKRLELYLAVILWMAMFRVHFAKAKQQ